MKYLAVSNTEAKPCAVESFIKSFSSGRKFTTGTVTFTTGTPNQIIYHNLGVKPSYFCLYPLFEPDFTQGLGNVSYMYVYYKGAENGIPRLSEKCVYWNMNINNGLVTGGTDPYAYNENAINEEYVQTRSVREAGYNYPANKEFGWIAIE